MGYLIFILVSISLLGAFLLLTVYERKRGIRLLAPMRARLDAEAGRAEHVVRTIDLVAFVGHVLRATSERAAHDSAHGTLRFVRAVERLLTRVVQYLRMRRSRARVSGEERPHRAPWTRLHTSVPHPHSGTVESSDEEPSH